MVKLLKESGFLQTGPISKESSKKINQKEKEFGTLQMEILSKENSYSIRWKIQKLEMN